MNNRYEHLLKPIRIGSQIFRNRVWAAPITPHALQATEPWPAESTIRHYAGKAAAGAACVTCSGISLLPEENDGEHLGIDFRTPSHRNYLSQLAEAIHASNAKASMELGGFHIPGACYAVVGGVVDPLFGGVSEEMPLSVMELACQAYADAAEACVESGFDCIMLNFGHHNDMGQFLSPMSNTRADDFGGESLENRARFPIMLLNAVRSRIGRGTVLELRISGSEYEPGGITIEESIAFTRMIEDTIDIIHVSAGTLSPRWIYYTHPSALLPPMPNAHLAKAIKQANVRIPVMAVGGIQDLDMAESFMAESGVDLVSIARGLIADPELVHKAYAGRGEDVTPCLRCMHCHDSAVTGRQFRCSVNPQIGIEHLLDGLICAPEEKKTVAVIGGGPAGLKAALTAADRGHEVHLFEQEQTLGGQLRFADHVPFKQDLKKYKDYLIAQVRKRDIQVCLGIRATSALLTELEPDAVIVAIGAENVRPPVPGVDRACVMQATEIFGQEQRVGQTAVVIGGGQVGCETALHLAKLGREVIVVEMAEELFSGSLYYSYNEALISEMELTGRIEVLTDTRCLAIWDNEVNVLSAGSEKSLRADTVILATGLKPRLDEAVSLMESAPVCFAAGDCIKAASVEEATRTAFYAASEL